LRISKGVTGGRRHYTLSHDDGLDAATAARLARLIARLEGIPDPVGLARGPNRTVHIVEAASASLSSAAPAAAY
jgi:hypothetical protein